MRRLYTPWAPKPETLRVITQADEFLREFAAQGYDVTLRQLYYRFVSRDLIANQDREYNRLGSIVNKARLAGLLDWGYIVDRTRNLQSIAHWTNPAGIMQSAAQSFALDKWTTQPTRIEVWVEKEALAGIVGQAARSLDVSYFSCRGYVSQSELWAAAQRLKAFIAGGQNVIVLHLGDHDPSGIDMTRDIEERLNLFIETDWLYDEMDVREATVGQIRNDMILRCDGRLPLEVRRIALNRDQIDQYDPPPNPAKLTDARAEGYIAIHGRSSWELDALEPAVLDGLITGAIVDAQDPEAWEAVMDQEQTHVELLRAVGLRWLDVVEFINASS